MRGSGRWAEECNCIALEVLPVMPSAFGKINRLNLVSASFADERCCISSEEAAALLKPGSVWRLHEVYLSYVLRTVSGKNKTGFTRRPLTSLSSSRR